MSRRVCLLYLAAAIAWSGAAAAADDPKLAPGRDPKGTAVAVFASGFDYTHPEIGKILARDGEGEAIAWDMVDGDHLPYAADGGGSDIARTAAADGGVRVVMVRVADGDPATIAKGFAFTATTPATIVLAPLTANTRTALDVLLAAARRFETLLIVTSLPTPTNEERAAADATANLVLLGSVNDETAAAKAVSHALGCGQDAIQGEGGAALKAAFLARLERQKVASDCKPQAEAQPK